MASTQCNYPGCSEPAKAKCGGCGKVYCVLHIQRTGPIDTCDLCIARAIAEKEAAAARERAKQARDAAEREVEREAEAAKTLAKLQAERSRREANRKKRVMLARIGISMILGSLLLFAIYMASFSPGEVRPLPHS
jgi:uncharacterized membrane protein YdbT with pleckstrin-like domain